MADVLPKVRNASSNAITPALIDERKSASVNCSMINQNFEPPSAGLVVSSCNWAVELQWFRIWPSGGRMLPFASLLFR